MRYLLALLLIAGCAAAPQDPCARQCNHVYNSCMDAGSISQNPMAQERVGAQCNAAYQSCVRACRQE